MRIDIASIGRLKSGPERELYDRYMGRAEGAGKQLSLGPFRLIELNESKASKSLERKKQEAAKLIEKQDSGTKLFVWDERGKNLTSRKFSEKLITLRDEGHSAVRFVIGGPDGVADSLKKEAAGLLSFGAMTLPHGIARILLAEQLYRAITIANGHPYHRD